MRIARLKRSFHCLLLSGLMLIALNATAYAAVTCPSKPAGTVRIIWGSESIQYDFTKSQAQMNRMQNDTTSPYGRDVETHVGGLMRGGVSIKSQVQVSTLTYPRSRQVCQWIDNVEVNVTIDPKIYIAREHKRGTCRHNAIMEHEMKHIQVDRDIVKRAVPMIRQRLEKAVRDVGIVGPKDARDQNKYQRKINQYIADEIADINEIINIERRKRQQAVDTLEEYERVANMCR